MKLKLEEVEVLLDHHKSIAEWNSKMIGNFSALDKSSDYYEMDKIGHNEYYKDLLLKLNKRIMKLERVKLKIEAEL